MYVISTIALPEAIPALNSLQRLTVLTITICSDIQNIPEDFGFPYNLEKFSISIDCSKTYRRFTESYAHNSDVKYGTLNTLTLEGLNGPRGVRWIGWVKMLLKRTQSIVFCDVDGMKNIVPNLSHNNGDGLNSLKNLKVVRCNELEYLIDTETGGTSSLHDHIQVLSELENLHFQQLSTLKGLCNVAALPSISRGFLSKLQWLTVQYCEQFSNICNLSSRLLHLHSLRVVSINGCARQRCIFGPSVARSLQQLEIIEVYWCEAMEEIVEKEDEEEGETVVDNKIVFNSLKTLRLCVLPNLNGFCTGSFIFEWPSLEEVTVSRCPKMKTFAATSSASGLQSTPKLKSIKLDQVDRMLEGVDLNNFIGNHSNGKEKQSTTSEAGPS